MDLDEMFTLDEEKKFEVYDIKWVIEDFNLAMCSENWSIASSEFTVTGLHTTKWLFILTPAGDFIEFKLKRYEFDDGPEEMFVEWRMRVVTEYDDDRTQTVGPNRFNTFGKGIECRETFEDLSHWIGKKVFSVMTIYCEMVIPSLGICVKTRQCKDTHQRRLSEDLLNLFTNGRDYDLKLIIGNESIFAHKAIVCTRIRELNRLLAHAVEVTDTSTGRIVSVIDFSHLNYPGMERIMKYLYSGDSSHVFAPPSLDIYDCVLNLKISHLMKYFTANKLTLRTSVDAREVRFIWNIMNFNDVCNSRIDSPLFPDDSSQTAWRLCYFPTEDGHVSISADNVRETRAKNICLEFAILDGSGNTVFAKSLRSTIDKSKTFGFVDFNQQSVLVTYTQGNILNIMTRLKLSDGTIISCIEETYTPVIEPRLRISSFDLLSSSMESVFNECAFNEFTDVRIRSNGHPYGFLVHNCIVSQRCSWLSSLISAKQNFPITEITIPGIETQILCLLLRYLYSGLLHIVNEVHYTKLGDAARVFNLPLLENFCSDASGRANTYGKRYLPIVVND